MEIIKKLEVEHGITNGGKPYRRRMALFKCPYCDETIKRRLYDGIRDNSCGCSRYALVSISNKGNIKHGDKRKNKVSSIYRCWDAIMVRCLNKNNKSFYRYGGRNISVCDEWKNSYPTFKEWALKNGYKKGLQIDRKDNNGDYCPENCRFVKVYENVQNRSTTKLDVKKVSEIIKLKPLWKAGKYSQGQIGTMFGVSDTTIYHIFKGHTWKNVTHVTG